MLGSVIHPGGFIASRIHPRGFLANRIHLNTSLHRINPSSGLTRCYDEYGCLSVDERFQSVLRPINYFSSVERLKVDFLLYTRVNPDGPQIITPTVERIRSSYFRVGLPVKFLIHGFLANDDLEWIRIAKKELLRIEDMNVILVDWRNGATINYFRSASNVRILGAMVAKFVNVLHDAFSVPFEMVHLIGHSLGAQVAGHVGERIKNLGRITGLDPAQPYFENTHPAVHLDPTDALFVDVIHTDSEPIWRTGAGYGPPCGHVDFYPNGGETQAGCKKTPRQHIIDENYDLERAGLQAFACDHQRSGDYFIESLQATCPFMAVQCSSYTEFRKGRCFDCGSKGDKCAPLGYYSEQWFLKFGSKMNLPVKMFLMTGTHQPFCRFHHRIKLKTSANLERNSAIGKFLVKFNESEGSSRIHLNRKELKFQPVSTYMFVVTSRSAQPLKNIVLEWQSTTQPIPQLFSNAFSSNSEIEISSVEIEGLETRYRCIFPVDAVFTPKDCIKAISSDKCEDISDDDNKVITYPLPDSEFPGNSSSAGSLQKGNFVPKPTIIPQPLFKKRNEAVSLFLNPLIERLFSRTT
uniref:Phospholipase A1 n=1 Tax=Hemiscolopendra marginata TaxID=943146 RepID=A0A646QDY9_9MYRI